jgi:hypothetical protein
MPTKKPAKKSVKKVQTNKPLDKIAQKAKKKKGGGK